MEIAKTRRCKITHNLPPLKHRESNIMSQQGDTKKKTKVACKKTDVGDNGRIGATPQWKDRAGKTDTLRQVVRQFECDRMSIGSPIPAILPDEDDSSDRTASASPQFPAIKVSSCGELRVRKPTGSGRSAPASPVEALSPSFVGAVSGLLSLSPPLYRKSTDGRFLQVTFYYNSRTVV